MSHDLRNTGIVRINFEGLDHKDCATICVIGLPRSGTSLISSILYHLRVFTGDRSFPPTYEDKILKDLLDKDDWAEFKKVIGVNTKRYKKWAFKLPRATYKIKEVVSLLSNPIIICSVRDPLSIQLRKNISQKEQDVFKGMQESLESYQTLFLKLSSLECPIMLVAYDKVSGNIEGLVKQISQIFFPGGGIDIPSVIEKVVRDQDKYLENARFDKTWGFLESITLDEVIGWAIYQNPKNIDDVYVEFLSEDGTVIFETKCDVDRGDINFNALIDSDGEKIEPIIVRRNLKKFEGRIGFNLKFGNDVNCQFSAIRVKGDRKPFWYR